MSEEQAARIVNRGKITTDDQRAQSEQSTLPTAAVWARARRLDADRVLLEQELAALAQRDERVTVVSLLGRRTSPELAEACGGRFREAGGELDEAWQWCARNAARDCRPVVLLDTKALRRCFDRVAQELGPRRVGVTLVVCRDGLRTENGVERNDALAIPLLRLVEDLAIMVPTNCQELRAMLDLSAHSGGPAALVARKGLAQASAGDVASFGLGQAELLEKGSDVALAAIGPSAIAARKAARRLMRRGVNATVINARFVHPLDAALLLEGARRCGGLVLVEDGSERGGFASAVLELLGERSVATPVRLVDLTDATHGTNSKDGEVTERIVQQINRLVTPVPSNGNRAREAPPCSDQSDRARPTAVASASHGPPIGLKWNERCVRDQQLSATARRWVHVYSRIGRRNVYLWKWCLHGLELTTLSCVAPESREHLRDTKLLAVMLGVLLDDVADHPGGSEFLGALVDLVSGARVADVSGFSAAQQRYAEITRGFRDEFQERIVEYPCHDVYAELLRYDNLQVWNTMRYADLVNRHLSLLNLVEHDLYLTHNMQMMSFATLDLMCSPAFECTELGRLREAVWHAQCMARIGNLVSTWRREIGERDFTSAVFARAVLRGELTAEQLASGDRDLIESAIRKGRHEKYFLRCWRQHRESLRSMRPHIRSFDVCQLLHGLDRLIEMELSSRGRK